MMGLASKKKKKKKSTKQNDGAASIYFGDMILFTLNNKRIR